MYSHPRAQSLQGAIPNIAMPFDVRLHYCTLYCMYCSNNENEAILPLTESLGFPLYLRRCIRRGAVASPNVDRVQFPNSDQVIFGLTQPNGLLVVHSVSRGFFLWVLRFSFPSLFLFRFPRLFTYIPCYFSKDCLTVFTLPVSIYSYCKDTVLSCNRHLNQLCMFELFYSVVFLVVTATHSSGVGKMFTTLIFMDAALI